MENSIAFVAGISFILVGSSYILRWEDWSDWLKKLSADGRRAALKIGLLHLLVGTIILGFHWKWQGIAIVLTLMGVKAFIEAVVYLLFPDVLLAMLKWYEPRHQIFLRFGGIIAILIGLIVLLEWRQIAI